VDSRQLAFLDDIEDDLTAPKPKSKGIVKRVGAIGAALAAGTAFAALGAAPASAAPADVHPMVDCFSPDRVAHDYTKDCNSGAWVTFHYVGENPCGPGGNYSILYFDRQYFSPCTGIVDLPTVATDCG
jgi:hypothetical protein